MRWAVLQQLFGQGSSYLVFFVISAVVAPGELGLIALATASLAVLSAFTDTGFSAAVIQRRDLEPGHLSSTFGVNVVVGAALSLAGILVGLAVSRIYDSPRLFPLMAALAAGFLIRSIGLTHVAIAQRELRFRDLALRDLVAGTASVIVGVTMALSGFGVWSLVASSLVVAAVGVVVMWSVTDWRPRFREMSRAHVGDLWSYSSRVLGFNLGKALVQNSDRLIIGFMLGAPAVGIYTFAHKLVISPASSFVGAVGTYLFPALSRVQGDMQAVRQDYFRATRIVVRVVLAYLLLLVFVSPLLIGPVFGEEWRASVAVIRCLAVAAFLVSVFSPVGQLLKALNRPGWLLAWSIVFSILMLLGVAIGARWGVTGAALGFSAAHVIALPTIAWMTRRLNSFSMRDLAVHWRSSVVAAGGVALLLWALQFSELLASPVSAGLSAAIAIALYLVVLFRADRGAATPRQASSS